LDRSVGLLLDSHGGRLVTLTARVLLGRSAACTVVIDDLRVSAEHAVISWSGQHWEVRDLGSRNGTALDGVFLTPGTRVPLRRHARLSLGGGEPWLLADDRAVGPGARNERTGEIVHSTTGILALPSKDDPRATIFHRPDGQWLSESGKELQTVADRDHLEVDGERWLLFLPGELGKMAETQKADDSPRTLEGVRLEFAPSLDEENVSVRLCTADGKDDALPARSCHYMLLTLARARMRDAGEGIAVGEQGWMYAADLARMLQYTPERLNLEIFRARALFAKLGFADSSELVERRPSSRQLRIGIQRLDLARG
jgi:hypothetical protein